MRLFHRMSYDSFFKEICVDGLIQLSHKSKKVQFKQIFDKLTFENFDEIKVFLAWYGIPSLANKYFINESDTINIPVHNKNKNFNYDKAPQKQIEESLRKREVIN